MAQDKIETDKLVLGRLILLATDSVGMACEGAFWLFHPEDRQWRFYIITSLLETVGPRVIYLFLNNILEKKLSAEETNEIDLYIGSPSDHLVKNLRKQIRTDTNSTFPHELEVDVEGTLCPAIVYRLAPRMSEHATRTAGRRFKKMSREVVGA